MTICWLKKKWEVTLISYNFSHLHGFHQQIMWRNNSLPIDPHLSTLRFFPTPGLCAATLSRCHFWHQISRTLGTGQWNPLTTPSFPVEECWNVEKNGGGCQLENFHRILVVIFSHETSLWTEFCSKLGFRSFFEKPFLGGTAAILLGSHEFSIVDYHWKVKIMMGIPDFNVGPCNGVLCASCLWRSTHSDAVDMFFKVPYFMVWRLDHQPVIWPPIDGVAWEAVSHTVKHVQSDPVHWSIGTLLADHSQQELRFGIHGSHFSKLHIVVKRHEADASQQAAAGYTNVKALQ